MTNVRRAQTWTCHEADADPDDVPPAHSSVSLWPDYPRFSAVVDAVEGDVAQLIVGTSNDHPRAPDLGDRVDVHVDTLLEGDRWSLKSHSAGVEDTPEDPPLVTDGGQCVGGTDHELPERGFQTRGMEPQRNIYDFLLTIDAEFADELRCLEAEDKQEPAADHIKGAITHDMADVRFVGESFLLRGVTVGFDAAGLDLHKEMHGRQQYATHNIDTSTEAIEVIAAVSRWEELAYHLLEDQQEDDGLRADGGTEQVNRTDNLRTKHVVEPNLHARQYSVQNQLSSKIRYETRYSPCSTAYVQQAIQTLKTTVNDCQRIVESVNNSCVRTVGPGAESSSEGNDDV